MRTITTLLALIVSSCAVVSARAAHQKPNIIFILADEVEFKDLSCFGQKQFQTPQIDRLASEGRIFASAYAGGPWCAPSRTALLTGMNGSHFNVLARDAKGRATKFRPTVAEMLKSAGHRDLSEDPKQAARVARMTKQARQAGKTFGDDPATSPFWKKFDGKAARAVLGEE